MRESASNFCLILPSTSPCSPHLTSGLQRYGRLPTPTLPPVNEALEVIGRVPSDLELVHARQPRNTRTKGD
jgi:hypothetical protein